MHITDVPLKSVFQTGAEMRRIVETHYKDLGELITLPFGKFFKLVCNLPYVADPEGKETLSRPLYTLQENYEPRDCDDKAILIGSWLYGNGVPFHFIAVAQTGKRLHHVFCILDFRGKSVHADATYSKNILGNTKPWSYMLNISGQIRAKND